MKEKTEVRKLRRTKEQKNGTGRRVKEQKMERIGEGMGWRMEVKRKRRAIKGKSVRKEDRKRGI
jgi:hypothetical protein